MEAYALISASERFDLTNKEIINIGGRDIYEIKLPNNCKSIDCSDNILTELIIPDGCKKVYCMYNQLKELIIPDGCKYVSCFDNQLKELIIPDGCKNVWADMKSITELNKVEELNLII